MKKRISLVCILLIMLFSLTGCYNSVAIDKYYYIVALGIDLGKNDLLKISIQIANTSSGSSGSSDSSQSDGYNIYTVEAETIDSAISILNNYLNKKINLSHCTALVISEDLAKTGIKEYFSTLSNNTELRHTCEFLVSSTTALDILTKVSNSGEIFSSRLYDYLITSTDYTGFTIESTFGNFFNSLQNFQRDPVAIYSEVNDSTIQNNGTAVFKDDKMVGKLSILDTMSHLMVTNNLKTCTIDIASPFQYNEKIDLDIHLYKNTEININMVNGSPYIDISIYPQGTIKSSGESYNYSTGEHIQQIESYTNAYIKNIILNYLYLISKEYNADIVGFDGHYAKKVPTQEEFTKLHWNDVFSDSVFNVNVETKINSSNLFNKQ